MLLILSIWLPVSSFTTKSISRDSRGLNGISRPSCSHMTALVNTCRRVPLLLRMTKDEECGEDLQKLFAQHCDKDGLMTKEMLEQVPTISELLTEEDLLLAELHDLWEAAPKFPDLQKDIDRIDVDSFVQIYRDIDDLFEEEEDEEDGVAPTEASLDKTTGEAVTQGKEEAAAASGGTDDEDATKVRVLETPDEEEDELESFFRSICNSDRLVSKTALREWSEVSKLLQEGLLGEDEFEELWSKTTKRPGSSDQLLDVEGFLSFNVALDDLFVFEDDDDEETEPQDTEPAPAPTAAVGMVVGEDISPGVLFAALANSDYLVGMKELERWSELQEMLEEGELLPLELQNIFDDVVKAPGSDDQMDETGFTALWEAIDALFEDVDENEELEEAPVPSPAADNGAKNMLLSLLSDFNGDEERLPCGLESTEREERQVRQVVEALEESSLNLIRLQQGDIQATDLAGDWELLYSSSSAMKFNKGLSGLGGSVPNGKFAGLVQKLKANKYLTDVEYIERIEVNPSSASFDVRVTGDWDLRTSVSLFTGAPSTVMSVVPNEVRYGPTSTRADHWKSLGPLNMLDVTYLDDDLRVMRGNTSTDSIFIFRRAS